MNLGAKWEDKEIGIFFTAFQDNKNDHDRIKEILELQGFHRSKENISSLISKNKAFLAIPGMTESGLQAVMQDYYSTLELEKAQKIDEIKSEEEVKEPSMICNESLQIPKAFPFSSESSFTKNVHYMNDIGKREATGYELSSIKLQQSRVLPNEGPPLAIPAKRLEQSVLQQESSPMNTGFSSVRPGKKIKSIRSAGAVPQNSRKGLAEMSPYLLIVDELLMLHSPEITRNKQIEEIQTISAKVKHWVRCEYFYSPVDKAYFDKNELSNYIDLLDFRNRNYKRVEWMIFRKSIGKTRRFSSHFLEEERERLGRTREIARIILNSKPETNGRDFTSRKLSSFPRTEIDEVKKFLEKDKIVPLSVGQRVLAIHHKTEELKTGSILTTEVSSFDVRFDNPELGIGAIDDFNLIPIGEKTGEGIEEKRSEFSYLERQRMNLSGGLGEEMVESPRMIPVEKTSYLDETYTSMALLISLLERKNLLLKAVQQCEEKCAKQNPISHELQEQAAWLFIHLETTDSFLEEVIRAFRLRKIKDTDDEEGEMKDELDTPIRQIFDFEDGFLKCIENYPSQSTELQHPEESMKEEGKDQDPKLHLLISKFMNILNNLNSFYDVYSKENIDLTGKEEKRKELMQKCLQVNLDYILKQLKGMRKLVSKENIDLFSTLESKAQEIIDKYEYYNNVF